MTGQFIVATILIGMGIGFTARLWLQALQRIEFREIANFYRIGFLGFTSCLAVLVWMQALALIKADIGNAMMQGVSAMFVLFVLFAWGRLTALGLKFDATHQAFTE